MVKLDEEAGDPVYLADEHWSLGILRSTHARATRSDEMDGIVLPRVDDFERANLKGTCQIREEKTL